MSVKNFYIFVLFIYCCQLFSQRIDPKIQRVLNQAGITLDQAKDIARKDGLFDDVSKDLNSNGDGAFLEKNQNKDVSKEIIDSFDLDKSNNILENSQENSQENSKIKVLDNSVDDFEGNSNEGNKKLNFIENIKNIENIENYFGYDIFLNNPDIFQNSISEYVDPNYILGPGDEVILLLWGETELNNSFFVEKDGYLFIPNVGQVFVNGLTLKRLESKLFQLLKKVYSSLDPINGNATTFFDLSLGSLTLRPIRIFVLGNVKQPGAYEIKSSATLFTSLYYFNGPSYNGSLRDIKLIRDGEEIVTIDFYDYLLKGKQINDQRLQRNDVIFIPKRGTTVHVIGEINRPSIYELKKNDKLKSLIQIAGGLKTTTYTNRIKINRILPPEKRYENGIDRVIIDVDLNEFYDHENDFELYDGDEIEFFKINDRLQNSVAISGAISRPGKYSIANGLMVSDLIKKSDGLLGHAFSERVDIIRFNSDLTQSQITVNLDSALLKNSNHNLKLVANDSVIVHSINSMVYKNSVSINGNVLMPGKKPFREGMTFSDLVFMGGGFKNKSHYASTYLERAELYRIDFKDLSIEMIQFRLDSVLEKKGYADSLIQMGDEIRVFSNTEIIGQIENSVFASGAFKTPGKYNYFDDMTIRDLLFEAGAYEDKNQLGSLWLQRGDLITYDENYTNQVIKPFNFSDVINNEQNNFYLKKGDEIRLYSKEIFKKIDEVDIGGDIRSPGKYKLKKGMTLKDLILEAGGSDQQNNNFIIDISSINEFSKNEKNYANVSRINVEEGMENFLLSNQNNIVLKSGDIVTVRYSSKFKRLKTLSIVGNVRYPGEYVIRNSGELVTDIISRAGGLTSEAYALASEFKREGKAINLSFENIIKYPKSYKNFSVLGGDSIIIKGFTNIVTVVGEVNNPGNYQFTKGKRVSDYIDFAGGFTSDADKYNSFILFPNGDSKKLKFTQFPKAKDGSVINILKKGVKPEFNMTQYASNLTAIYSDFIQAYLLIQLAKNQNN
jgi:protein involved in polysaccharide export with SLBB domain